MQAVDVVVVGFGAAGACAAIEAAEAGAEVLVIDRFGGGGASAVSGGVVYAGGGTPHQFAAGVTDSVDAMLRYLTLEAGDAVEAGTLRRFCEQSVDMLAWLGERGVPFDGSLCPDKTSYPTNRHYLYYSGSERSAPFRDVAAPAPRGHRAKGAGTSGKVLFAGLAASALRSGVTVLTQTTAEELITDDAGRVTGVVCRTLAVAPRWVRTAHRLLSRYAAKPGLYVPALRKALHARARMIERRYGRPLHIDARRGVIISAGGFVTNREMLRTHAPAFRGGLPLGTAGDDGSGIRLGVAAGGAVRAMDRVSAWRFITPPSALLRGVLVDEAGRRVCDESRYGAAIGHELITNHGGKGWLLVDRDVVALARRQARAQSLWFQLFQVGYLLTVARTSAPTVRAVAARVGVDAVGLESTLAAYNEAARVGVDPAGKVADLLVPLVTPPYSLIEVSIRPNIGYPCPMLTLGGLRVDERTGQVLCEDGLGVDGLYAAGRSAVGICSNSYVSGLSLADCVFSGRRAGRSVVVPSGQKGAGVAHG